MRRILIVGAGYAGLVAATRLARKARRKASITIVDPRSYFVERVRLHEDVAGAGPKRHPLARRLAGTGVELRTGMVRAVDFDARRATIEVVEGGRIDEAFDDLILTSGSTAAVDVPGSRYATTVATEEDAVRLRALLEARPDARVVVCGGGLTGVELATELGERRRDLRVTLVTGGSVVPTLGEAARLHVRHALDRFGVERIEDARVAAILEGAVVLASGRELPSDITVWAGGFRAAQLVGQLGLAVDALGRALVDERLRSFTHPFVHVAGDAASTPLRMACATATPMGAFVADDIARELAGREAEAFSFGFLGSCVSLGRHDAVVQKTDAFDRPTYLALRGRPGAVAKELICRFAMHASTLERYGLGYHWARGPALLERPTPESLLA